ncbi:MAG: glycoside hydrolase [Imperialibacter sp.]|uniref:VPS10 domain-containing protein n=1 Tax=Imperialibacter sp. TaxID=2038411 RepID=UPI0032EECAD3
MSNQPKPILALLLGIFCLLNAQLSAQVYQPEKFGDMKWRMIGPHRGGRTVGAVGVPQQPNVFYIGVNNGGVWKTTDYGRTWVPIFDDQPTGSVGDIAVSPSNPNVLYVASGEGLQRPDLSVGNGMYKTTDGGKTWKHLGLEDGQQIGRIDIDPKNENRVFAAVLGHPYGPNEVRGVYRTLDGGTSWDRVLYMDENTGAIQVLIDPQDPNTVYASMWQARQGPWENAAWQGPNSGLYKSTDGGNTWKKLAKGLPTYEQGLGRIGISVAPSDNKRLYASANAPDVGGIFRSDDAGESWYLINNDPRPWGRGDDFAEIQVDPTNPDILYSANVVTWKSVDGGKTFSAFRGAPGGDDYHRIWINPTNPDIILIAADQGAIITVNGGETFSSWYNQPTAQFYHVSTDNDFPYNVYGGQQESGSVGIASRGNDGQITFREWHPVGVEEYGYVAADPLDPNIIYGGRVSKYNKKTGQVQNISPDPMRDGGYRYIRTMPILFAPTDPRTLYSAANVVFKTQNGGDSWDVISPDLTRATWDIPESVGIYTEESMKTMPRRGVIYTLAPSHVDGDVIWAGTDDGLIHVTKDGGKTWTDVTPPQVTSWEKVSLMDAGHFDKETAYAAINSIRNDDMKPHIFKTHDSGKTWTEIVKGLPNDPINVVREDPVRKGLLYAGSETQVHVSFDDGANWQPLRLNMPATSIRDLVIKDDDVVVGTHGRSFWILDDITPLRQLTTTAITQPVLFKPQDTYRVRWNMNTDTPLPQEEPAGQNPPDGAVINYYLPTNASEVTLEVFDLNGTLVNKYSSQDKPYEVPPVNFPHYWLRPQKILSSKAGLNRFEWDMHYTQLETPGRFSIAAIYQNSAPEPDGPFVLPDTYNVKLTVDGKSYSQPITIKMDPRVKTSKVDLQKQFFLSMACYETRKKSLALLDEMEKVSKNLEAGKGKSKSQAATASQMQRELMGADRRLSRLMSILQENDMTPTTSTAKAVKQYVDVVAKQATDWAAFKKTNKIR